MTCVWTQQEFGNIVTTCSGNHAVTQVIPWWAYGLLGLGIAAIVLPILIWRARRSE